MYILILVLWLPLSRLSLRPLLNLKCREQKVVSFTQTFSFYSFKSVSWELCLSSLTQLFGLGKVFFFFFFNALGYF